MEVRIQIEDFAACSRVTPISRWSGRHFPGLPELRARLYVSGADNICDMVRILITGGSGFRVCTLANFLSTKYEVFAAYLHSRPPESGTPLQFDVRDVEQ